MPNGTLSNNTIKNFSQEPLRRAEIVIGVGYSSDLKHVKDTLYTIIKSDPKILTEPAAGIEIKELADNAINIAIFIWADRPNYGAMVSDFYENTKAAFDSKGIELPFPQRDVHIKNDNNNILPA